MAGLIKRVRNRILTGLVYTGYGLALVLPFWLSSILARALAVAACCALPKERRRAALAIRDRLGFTPSAARALSWKVFQHYGLNAHEFVQMACRPRRFSAAITVEINGCERLEEALSRGKGVVFLSGHFGNWEIAGAMISRLGPARVVARPPHIEGLARLVSDLREKAGMAVIMRGKGTLAMVRILKSNQILAILNDLCTSKDTGPESRIEVPFFGMPALTHIAGVALAQRTGAALLTGFVARESPTHHVGEIQPPISFPAGVTGEAAWYSALLEYHRRLELFIRRYPEQWIWTHKRWRPRIRD